MLKSFKTKITIITALLILGSGTCIRAQTTSQVVNAHATSIQLSGTYFSKAERESLLLQLNAEHKSAAQSSQINKVWDDTFKIILLIITVLTTVFSSLGNREKNDAKKSSLGNATTGLAAAAVVLSTFAASQFNFAGRAQIYRNKADALQGLRNSITYLNPEKTVFLSQFQTVISWNDSTNNTSIQPIFTKPVTIKQTIPPAEVPPSLKQ